MIIKIQYTTTEKLNKKCKCCKAYLRAFKSYSLTDDYLKFSCSNCSRNVILTAKQNGTTDDLFIIEIGVYLK